eukprot:2645144-Karenia_brevis.AAC.1
MTLGVEQMTLGIENLYRWGRKYDFGGRKNDFGGRKKYGQSPSKLPMRSPSTQALKRSPPASGS